MWRGPHEQTVTTGALPDTDPCADPRPPSHPPLETTLSTHAEPRDLERGTLTPEQTEALVDEHARAVHRYARTRLSAAEAEDVVAEVFLIAWRKGEIPDEPRSWLLAVARRVLANQVRADRRRAALADRAVRHPAPPGQDDARLVDELDLLHRALALLRPADREVVELLAAAELSTGELARVLGCSATTAATRLYRARRRLRAAYRTVTEGQED
ncbi:sigma-70 family RNA polymerase sigma factor [Promicromonospora sp. NPDC050262]|uniref:RNA polymerase sigma factor n=1 Tax=Promicromonospora sp. NPDC050262 TaxID=3155036 RepID=UPI0033F719FF